MKKTIKNTKRKVKAFAPVDPKQNFPALEQKILAQWKKNKIFEQSVKNRPASKEYVFYDGPPFATGLPHYGHLLAGTMKDVVPRYWTMRGKRVERRFGWDCHGLPIENLIEKELGLTSKRDIEEKLGVDKFNEACRASVLKYVHEWESTVDRMGRWVDFKNDYKTMDPSFMESIWWVFSQLWDKGLIYRSYKSMHLCPRCATPLSNFEVTLGYKEITDCAVTAKFKLIEEEEPTFLLAWTTTPWTLPGNTLLAVGENIDYVKIKANNEYYILAKALTDHYFGDGKIEVIEKFKGKKLIGKKYEPLFPYIQKILEDGFFTPRSLKRLNSNESIKYSGNFMRPVEDYTPEEWKHQMKQDQKDENTTQDFENNAYQVVHANFVSIEEGTGIVHIAPAFGEDDFRIGQENKVPLLQHVDQEGHFNDDVTYKDDELQDLVKDEVKPKDDPSKTDRKIVEILKKKERFLKQENYKHSYPHCWRCDSPLLNYATDAWFVSIDKIKKTMLKENEKVHWVPSHVGQGRFNEWLKNARDWCISRSRYWGTPLPVWIGEKSGEAICIGSIKELEKCSGEKVEDLHKHFVDKITFQMEVAKGAHKGEIDTFRRIPEVLDCWFESGSMPYAQMHYPFENRAKFEKNFPAEYIAEGLDQTRGWFYTLVVLGVALYGVSPFKNVVVNGLLLAEDGKKMSKRLKNYPDPAVIFDKYGADALRFYLMNSPAVKAEPLCFSERGVENVVKNVILPLWNAYSFFVTYANIDGWKPKKWETKKQGQRSNKLDRWLLSELHTLLAEVTREMDEYNLQAIRPMYQFIDHLTNWYIRRSRRRFWKSTDDRDKKEGYETLYTVLTTLSQIIAPVMPFLAEAIYQNLVLSPLKTKNYQLQTSSVHLTDWPKVNPRLISKPLNQEVELAQKIATLGNAARARSKIKNRQPLAKAQIGLPEPLRQAFPQDQQEVIREELNVKELEVVEDPGRIAKAVVQPNPKLLGPKYGKDVQFILAEARAGNFELLENGTLKIGQFELAPEEYNLGYQSKEGMDVESDGGIVVALDTRLTPALKKEGIARDLIRQIQDMRKEAGYNVEDRIEVGIVPKTDDVRDAVEEFAAMIARETLAVKFELKEMKGADLVKDLDEERVGVRKANR